MSYKIDCLKCVKNDWYHKWCSLHDYRLCDYVKGPLKFPMVTIPIPYEIEEKDRIDRCDCAKYLKEFYSKPGIPDPWSEYLILRKETEKGKDVSSDFPKCDLDITRYIDRNYRVYLGQGIPDPWKRWTRIEPSEPSIDDLKKNWKGYIENLRIGPGCDMYDVDKVCCPNCERQLLCLKKSNHEDKETEKEVLSTDSVPKPTEEKLIEKKIYLKDACVETDCPPDMKNNQIQISKTCSCKSSKICRCGDNCLSCPVCNKSKNEERTERCIKNDSCFGCKKNSIANSYFYNARPNFPMRFKNIGQSIPVADQGDGHALPKLDFIHQGTILPFFYSSPEHCACSAQHFIGFEEKNNHGLELQLICPKCERKRKKRSRTKCEQRKENRSPCHCRHKERVGSQRHTYGDEHDCDICDPACKAPRTKERIRANTSCKVDQRCRCHSEEANKTRIFEDGDYTRMLEVLGCADMFSNTPDMDWDKSKTSRKKISPKGNRRSLPRPNHSYREDNASDIIGRGFHDCERGRKDRNYEIYGISRRSTGTKNEFETVQKDSRYNNYEKAVTCRLPYNSHYAVDELRKMRSDLRRQGNKNAFGKYLSYFLSDSRKNKIE